MNLRLNNEFLYQIFALLLAVIVVHGIYIGVIRPTADAQLAAQAALQAAGEDVVSLSALWQLLFGTSSKKLVLFCCYGPSPSWG